MPGKKVLIPWRDAHQMLGTELQVDVGAKFQLLVLECRGEFEVSDQVDENYLQGDHRIPVSCFVSEIGKFNTHVCNTQHQSLHAQLLRSATHQCSFFDLLKRAKSCKRDVSQYSRAGNDQD